MKIRPIDANALNAKFEQLKAHPANKIQDIVFLVGAMYVVDAAPTLGYAPVRHGEWIELIFSDTGKFAGYKCSECGLGARRKFAYCHCGAKMDKEKENA